MGPSRLGDPRPAAGILLPALGPGARMGLWFPSAPIGRAAGPPCALTFSSISLAVCLVVSRFSTKAVSPRKFPDAADRRASRESSSSFRTILNSF